MNHETESKISFWRASTEVLAINLSVIICVQLFGRAFGATGAPQPEPETMTAETESLPAASEAASETSDVILAEKESRKILDEWEDSARAKQN
jgi:hypothetical protein